MDEDKLPSNWDKLLREHWQQIVLKNVDVFDVKEEPKRNLGLVFKVPLNTSRKIKNVLDEIIPESLKGRILFQPFQGYHFTIQWSSEEYHRKINMALLKKELMEIFSELSPIEGQILFPYFGKMGLLGIFKTKRDRELLVIRQRVYQIWQDLGLPLGFPQKYYDLAYLSLSRYAGKFTKAERESLRNLPKQEIPEVRLTKTILVLNDKFMTPENTEVLKELVLRGI